MPFWAPYITPLPIIDGGTGASTTAQDLINLGAVPNTVTVAGHPLSSNVTITAADVGADPAGTAAAAIAGIGTGGAGSGAMVLISSQTLASPASSVTFTAIPGTYTHLRVVWQARGTTAATDITGLNMQCNGDTGADYDRQYIINNPGATTLNTAYQTAQTSYGVGGLTATTADAGNASGGTIDIPNYAGTTFNKLFYASSIAIGSLASQRLQTSLNGGQWRNTAAITSLTFFPWDGGTNFVAGSQFVLYGY